jgi:nucleotide-binding universal stress UspA family protein
MYGCYDRSDWVCLISLAWTGLGVSSAWNLMRLPLKGTAPVLLVRPFGDPEPVTLQHAVVPLDGSERAEEALQVVDQLARYVVHEVTLLRVIGAAEEGPDAKRYLDEVAGRLTQEHLACQRRVEQGDPAATIIDVAGTDKVVVMATHGRSGLTRWALGSVADRVARGGVAAVLLVRAGATERPQPTAR